MVRLIFGKIIAFIIVVASCSGCDFVDRLIHDDETVARLGLKRLYKSQLEKYIPVGMNPEDSTKLVRQYINTWAREQIYIDIAESELSKEEKNVEVELEEYKNSLLKYRYEQKFVNERLDTSISAKEVEDYYKSHQEIFILDRPLVRARILDIMGDSPKREELLKSMSSENDIDLVMADSIAYVSAIRYADHTDKWLNIVDISRELGVDYGDAMSKMKGSDKLLVFKEEERPDIRYIYVKDRIKAGEVAPLEYCEERIRDIILSARKNALLNDLERDLLNDAKEKKYLKIY